MSLNPLSDPNPMTQLERDIRDAINTHSAENESDTPDFVLAEYVTGCLDAFNKATRARTQFRTSGENVPQETAP